MVQIKDIQANQRNLEVQGTLVDASPVKTFDRFGGQGVLRIFQLKDESGQVSLTLWDENAEKFEVGDVIRATGINSKLWRDQIQLSTSRKSEVEKIE